MINSLIFSQFKMPKLISSKLFNRKDENNTRTFLTEEKDIIFNDGAFENVINMSILDDSLKRIDEVGNTYFSEIPKDKDYMETFTSIVHVIQSVKNNAEAREKLTEHIRNFFSHVKHYNPGTPYSYFLGCNNALNNMFSNINCSPFCAVGMKDNDGEVCSHNVFTYFDSMYHLNLNKDSDYADIFIPTFVKKIDSESIQSLKDIGISKVSLYTMDKNKFIPIKDTGIIDSFKNEGLEVTEKVFDNENNRDLRSDDSSGLTGLQLFFICLAVFISVLIIILVIYFFVRRNKSNILFNKFT